MNPQVSDGETYIFFVPPGWLIAGTVDSIIGAGPLENVVLRDAVYLEGVNPGKCMISDLPAATTPEQQRAVVRVSWPLPRTNLLASQISMAFRCNLSMVGLLEAK